MNLKPDTFKVWEPKIIGIVLSFPVEWSTEMGPPLCKSKGSCALSFACEEKVEEEWKASHQQRQQPTKVKSRSRPAGLSKAGPNQGHSQQELRTQSYVK